MRRSPARHAIQPPTYQPPYYPPMPYYPPPERRGSAIGAICTVVLTFCALAMVSIFVWKVTGGVLPSLPTLPTVKAIANTGSSSGARGASTGVNDAIARYNAAQEATAAALSQAAGPAVAPRITDRAPAGVDTLGNALPTAVVLIPTVPPVDQITVVPDLSKPIVYAAGSDMRPTPVVVMPYPTALPQAIADDFEVSPDGTCITAPRDGKRYQVCQGWKYAPQELATVADLIRGGTLAGVEVQ